VKKLLIGLLLTFLLLFQSTTAKSIFDFSNEEENEILSEKSRDSLALIYTDYLKMRQTDIEPAGFTSPFPPQAVNPLSKFAKDSTCFKFEGDRFKEGAELDSSGNYMVIYERLFEEDFNQTTVMNLDDYAKARLAYEERAIWNKEIAKNTGNEESDGILDELAIDIPFKIKSKTFHRVFGGNKIGLRANGTLSLSMKYNTNYLQNSSFPTGESSGGDIKFEQTQDFSITGKIGTKVDVEISQSTQKMDFENTMKITYTGESDEIVEKIEAGNISLSLPGTQFATFSGTNKGLYGIKTDLRFGNFKSTFIASLEKGESQELELPLGVKNQVKTKYGWEYAKMRKFFLDDLYRTIYNDQNNLDFRMGISNIYEGVTQGLQIRTNELKVFVSTSKSASQMVNATLLINGKNTPASPINLDSANLVSLDMPMLELTPSQYVADDKGWIRIIGHNFEANQYIAVYYSTGGDLSVGDVSDPKNFKLQVIGRKDRLTKDKFIDLEWKNIYDLEASDVTADGFSLSIKKTIGSEEKDYFINKDGAEVKYNKVYDINSEQNQDLLNLKLLNSEYGDFTFPDLQPFNPLSDNAYINTKYKNLDPASYKMVRDSIIYTTGNESHSQSFKLYFDFSSKSRVNQLGFNVLEGSEVVMADSKKLERDVDYNIDYQTGQLSIIKDAYLSQNITIKYERASFFQLDQKVLLGNRWQYDFNDGSFLGLSLLYYSKTLRDERIHVGYEPINNFIWDVNGLYSFDAPYLTQAADWLPLIQTDKESKIKFEGEIAQIIPNPNPLNKAYIDDFENSERKRSLGLSDALWHQASPPDSFFVDTEAPDELSVFNPAIPGTLLSKKAVQQYFFRTADSAYSEIGTNFYWYNKKENDNRPIYKEIYDIEGLDLTDDVKNQKFNTLNFKYRPKMNKNAFNSPNNIDKKWLWNGVMRYLPVGYMQDFSEMKYLEILVKASGTVNFYIDLGRLSEDVIPNGEMDEEKTNSDNITVSKANDIGLDKKDGNGFYSLINSDSLYAFPSFDVYPTGTSSDAVDYYLKNNTDGNEIYDTENLKKQGSQPEMTISAYRYLVKLNQPNNPDGVIVSEEGLQSGWKLVRIPLNKMIDTLGYAPEMKDIRYAKLWFNGTDRETDIEIAAFDVAGNEWTAEDYLKNDIEAKIISTENGDLYPDPGFGFDKDKESKETSLQVTINAKNRKEIFVTKKLVEAESYMMYKDVSMLIYGGIDKNDNSSWSDSASSLAFFYRMGSDSNNYYQYSSQLVRQSWEANQMTLEIDSMTAIKTKRNNYNNAHAGEIIPKIFTTELPPGIFKRYLSIVGNPSLQSVKYFAAGVMNNNYTSTNNTEIKTGFLLNDIHLKNVRKKNALAMRASVSVNIADVATISAGITKKDADFHTVSEKGGTGSQALNYDVSTSANIDKLFPSRWGVTLPVSYSYANSYSHSKFEGSTDILVDEKNIPDSVKTKQISEAFTYSVKKSSKSDDPLLKYTIDNLSYSGTSNFIEGSNPESKYTESETYSNNISYGLNLPGVWFSLPIFGWTKDIEYLRHLSNESFNFFPNNYSVSLSTNQGRNQSVSRKNTVTQNTNFTVARTFNTSLAPFSILKSDYTLTLNSDMYKQRRNLLDTTLVESENPGVVGNSGYVNTEHPLNPVIFTHKPGLRGYDRLFMFDFGELDTWKSSFNTSLQFDLTKWTAYSFSHNTSYNWNANLTTPLNGRSLSNSYSVSANTRLKSKEVFQSLDATYNAWFPAKTDITEPLPDSVSTETEQPSIGDDRITPGRGGRNNDNKTPKKTINFNLLSYFKESLNDINLTMSTNRSASIINGYDFDQANLEFQLGFSRIPQNYTEGSMTWAGGYDWKVSTGLNIMKEVSLSNLSYTFKRNYSDNNVDLNGSDSKTQFVMPPFLLSDEDDQTKTNIYDDFSLPLPDYSISYSGLKDLFKVDHIFSSLDLSHSKAGSRSEIWYLKSTRAYSLNGLNIPEFSTEDSSLFIVKSKKYNITFSPVIGLKMVFKNQINFDASFDYSFDLDEGYLNRIASSGSKKEAKTYKVSAGYSQKGGFQTPFNFWPFSGKKMDNDIVYSLGASYGITRNYTAKLNGGVYAYEPKNEGAETIITSLSPKISYKLAKNIDGSFSYSYSRRESMSAFDAPVEITADHIMDLTFTMKIVSK